MEKNSQKENFVVDKNALLDRIKTVYALRGNKELADFLGVSKSTVSNWYARNTVDYDVVFSRCEQSDILFLLSGLSSAIKSETAIEKQKQRRKFADGSNSLRNIYDPQNDFDDLEQILILIELADNVLGQYVPSVYINEIYNALVGNTIQGADLGMKLQETKLMHSELKKILSPYKQKLKELVSILMQFDEKHDHWWLGTANDWEEFID